MPSSTPRTTASGKHRSATTSRTSTSARSDIIAMLKTDHRKVKKAFRDFSKLNEDEDAEECEALVRQTCLDLAIHAALEEELFYPAARDCLGDEALIDEAEVEHATLTTLIGALDSMAPGDDKYAATFTVLGEYVRHHVGEEEGEVFPRLSRVKYDWQSLKQAMEDRREALAAEHAKPASKPARAKASPRSTSGNGTRGEEA